MICDSQNALCARTGLAVLTLVALAGTSHAQIETRDWLLPQSGLWSDAANWSDANVPDTVNEIARLSPGAAGPPGSLATTPLALVDGIFEILRLQGNGSVEVFIDEGAELSVFDGVIEGVDGGNLAITLGSSLGDHALPSVLSLGDGAGRDTVVSNTSIRMLGEGSSPSIIRGKVRLDATSRIEGQGVIERVTNYADIVVAKQGNGSGELRFTGGLSNSGIVNIESTGRLVFDGHTLGQAISGEILNNGNITFLDATLSGGTLTTFANATIDFIGECTLRSTDLLGGTTRVTGYLNVDPANGTLDANEFVLLDGAEMHFVETTFLEGNTGLGAQTSRILFAQAESLPKLSVPPGEALVNTPSHEIRGAGEIEADFFNFGKVKIDPDLLLEPTQQTLRVVGEFYQASTGSLSLKVDPNEGDLVVDELVVSGGDIDLNGSLDIVIGIVIPSPDPLNQIAIANRRVTLIRIDDPTGTYSVTGEFDDVSVLLFDDRISPTPELIYLPDRVDVRFYCRADVNRDASVTPADFTAWLNAYQQGNPLADMNNDGTLSSSDFTRWVELFNRGCPQ